MDLDARTAATVSAIFAGLVLVLFCAYWMRAKRVDAIRSAASRLGAEHQDGNERPTAMAADFSILRRGTTVQFEFLGTIRGKQELLLFIYEYHLYWEDAEYLQVVAALPSPDRELPTFRIVPKDHLGRLAQLFAFESLFGFRVINFLGDSHFSRRYRVECKHEAAARGLLTTDARYFIAAKKNWLIEGVGHWLVIYRSGFAPTRTE